ncbi:hypothetical protein PN465_01020 [Nodularia spumigena CS-584]|jgi:hypothetical protein|uniref:Uncharacterized protein n=3 Tax=Nodularia spumigena TaxID=70799 RepID=A0A2S0Q6L7_NODSP|nr:hypothetical protein [Nodularia spumigena]AHJ27630.1 hypothetical protein NSP_12900 [Nodularia spumigena CCY9414]AVZ30063.1 hypothetical protein BMF81_01240 [Nodularia spumigena UHCC 0039]EAW44975.1 hypothetical protein N9414_06594 [Nodularia spumigena CCY9414]KZL50155.1 hypothetical protein A2T98_09070 [Nodularia spumigena CENA596]MDB9344308.1 hypothetical protein [Nodularia spumigena CS-588/06]
MKFNKKVAIALVTVSTSVFGFGAVASAGEGGAAGAVAATLDADGLVIEMVAAGAVGKNDAAAVATANFGVISASALGSAGVIQLLSDNGFYSFSEGDFSEEEVYNNVTIEGGTDTALENNQANSIATFTETPIGSIETGF